MHRKITFDRCYCINSSKYLLKFGKKYGTISCRKVSAHFFEYSSCWSGNIKRFKMVAIIGFVLDASEMTSQVGCCTAVLVQNEIQTQ